MMRLGRRSLLQIIVSFMMYHGTTSKATFELDLLKYEALPNKCCDGYKWVKIGPAKCNECDPYFRICMSHMPGGPSKCVTTTRENNVHTSDLTRGNIQPNHLSLGIDNLQGSLAIDVDIKDYDSTSKDDDIDHLFYMFKSIASTEKVSVVLNGTRVRLTISLKVSCEPGFYGMACNTQCIDGTNWTCSSNGTKLCRNGFSGPDCSFIASTPALLSTQKNNVSMKTSTDKAFTATYPPASTDRAQNNTISTSSMTYSTENSTRSIGVKRTTTIPSESTHTTTSASIYPTTLVASISTQIKTTTTMSMEHVQNVSEQMTTEPSTQTRQSRVSSSNLTTDAPNGGIPNILQSTLTEGNSSMLTTMTILSTNHSSSAQEIKLRIPEPLEVYSCNLVIEGYKIGLRQPMEEILTYVLTRHGDSTDIKTLQAHVTSSTFEITDNGVDVTDVSFVVQRNGAILTSVEVLRQLYSPMSSKLLADHLHARNLKEHSSITTITPKSTNNTTQWVSDHLPFVIVISCVVLFCLLVFATIAGRSITRRKMTSAPKTQKVPKSVKYNDDQTIQMFSNTVAFDTPFSLDNPLYDYSYDQLQPMDGSNV